jgi:hypothetical protein
VAAARCVLLKSGKNGNIDDDDDALRGESDWSEEDFADGEMEIRKDDKNGNDGRTEVGKIMETSDIGKLGNKPPTNAYVKINKKFQVKPPSTYGKRRYIY